MRNQILKFRAWDIHNKKFTYWTMNDLCTYAEKAKSITDQITHLRELKAQLTKNK